jgi:hypothetical protein
MMLGLQEAAIMRGYPADVISPPEYQNSCVGGGCWNINFLWFITLLLESVGRVVNLHLETIGRAIHQISTSINRVVI